MRCSVAAGLFGLAACGRVGFDAVGDGSTGDAPTDVALLGHDEDGDGIDDGPDVCPHIADPGQDDLDGDRIGDACDPKPDVPQQSRGAFLSMTAANAPTMFDPGWNQLADSWLSSSSMVLAFDLAAPLDNADIWVGINLISLGPAPRQFYIAPRTAGPAHYQAEIYDDGTTSSRASIVYWTGSMPTFFGGTSSRSFGTDLRIGLMTARMQTRSGTIPVIAADMDWVGLPTHLELSNMEAASFVGADRLMVGTVNVQLAVDYVFVVTTTP